MVRVGSMVRCSRYTRGRGYGWSIVLLSMEVLVSCFLNNLCNPLDSGAPRRGFLGFKPYPYLYDNLNVTLGLCSDLF